MPNFDVDESGGSKDRRLLFQEAIAAQAAERARELRHLRGQVEHFSFFFSVHCFRGSGPLSLISFCLKGC